LLKRLSFLHHIFFVKNQLASKAWIYVWVFYSVPVIWISIFFTIPFCIFIALALYSLKLGIVILLELDFCSELLCYCAFISILVFIFLFLWRRSLKFW
jgi:hypothetical protein